MNLLNFCLFVSLLFVWKAEGQNSQAEPSMSWIIPQMPTAAGAGDRSLDHNLQLPGMHIDRKLEQKTGSQIQVPQ